MLRRTFLISGAGAVAALGQTKTQQPAQQKPEDVVIAGATQDPTPRVAIVLSSFKQGEDHDGTKIPGLKDPQAPGANLTAAQLDAMVRKAIDLAGPRSNEFFEVIEPEDWVVIKTHPRADYRIAATVLTYLAEHKRGLRYTIVDRLAKAGVWPQDYQKLVSDLGAKFKGPRFELLDLNSAPMVDLPLPDKPGTSYNIPKIIQQCDRLVSIAPLATDAAMGVSLAVGNYAALPSKPVSGGEALIDVFSYRPADMALVGGSMGYEGEGTPVRHNVIVACMKAPAADSIAASVMGFNPADLPYLAIGEKRGFGIWNPDEIWMRGSDLEEAKKEFKKPAAWRKPGA